MIDDKATGLTWRTEPTLEQRGTAAALVALITRCNRSVDQHLDAVAVERIEREGYRTELQALLMGWPKRPR